MKSTIKKISDTIGLLFKIPEAVDAIRKDIHNHNRAMNSIGDLLFQQNVLLQELYNIIGESMDEQESKGSDVFVYTLGTTPEEELN